MELLRAKQEREQDDDDEVDSDSEVGGEQDVLVKIEEHSTQQLEDQMTRQQLLDRGNRSK